MTIEERKIVNKKPPNSRKDLGEKLISYDWGLNKIQESS